MPVKRGYLAPQNTFIETVIRKFDGCPGRNFVIGNALSDGCPIIYCNNSFCNLTGYQRHEVVQKECSCVFLHGPDTDFEAKESIKKALRKNEEYHIETWYYKRSGERFRCSVIVAPIKNEQGKVIMYIVNHQDMTPYEENNSMGSKAIQRKSSIHFNMSLKRKKVSEDVSRHKSDKNGVNVCVLDTLATENEIDRSQNSIHVVQPHIEIKRDDSTIPPLSPMQLDFSSRDTYLMRRICSSSLTDLCQERQQLLAPKTSIMRASSSEGNVALPSPAKQAQTSASKLFELRSGTSVKSSKVAQVMSLGADYLPEYRVESPKIHPWTILHYSPFKAIWDWIVLFLVMYTAIVTPFMAAFVLTRNTRKHFLHDKDPWGNSLIGNDPLVIVDYIVDVMFIIDIFINFRTTFVDANDEVVSDPCRVAVHYMKNWFIIDLLAAIPFELLIMIGNTDQTTTLIGLLKTARLLRLVRVVRKLDRYSEYGAAILLLLMFVFALVAHWLACGWYAIGLCEKPEKNDLGWLAKLGEDMKMPYNESDSQSGPDIKSSYLTALYFTLSSLTSVGFGNVSANTNNEKAFTILVMFVGALMHAAIFGNVTAIIQRLYSGMAHYHATMRKVREFIRFYQIPSPLRQRLEDYAQYDYSYTNGIDMNEVLRNFPEGLQAEICLHLNKGLLESNKAFGSATPGCLRALCLKLFTTHCPPGDYIIHAGDEITNLYWIGRGTVEILLDETVIAILGKDDSFGENFGITAQRVTGKARASVRALTYCDLHSISRENLLYIMRAYPEFCVSFNDNMKITFDLRDRELEKKDERNSVSPFNELADLEERRESLEEYRYKDKKTGMPPNKKENLSAPCSCSDIRYELQELKDRLYTIESSMKEDMKLILGLLRHKKNGNANDFQDRTISLTEEHTGNSTSNSFISSSKV